MGWAEKFGIAAIGCIVLRVPDILFLAKKDG